MKKVALTVLSLGLAFANVSNASIITLGILPALSRDFVQSMNYNCVNNVGRMGEIMACVGQWILDEDTKTILQALGTTGALQGINSKIVQGDAGNVDVNVSDALISQYGEDKVRDALKAYVDVLQNK